MPAPKISGLASSAALERPVDGALRVLAITRNFPNRLEPLACAFQRQQLACLGRRAKLEVLATIPYLPGAESSGTARAPAA